MIDRLNGLFLKLSIELVAFTVVLDIFGIIILQELYNGSRFGGDKIGPKCQVSQKLVSAHDTYLIFQHQVLNFPRIELHTFHLHCVWIPLADS